MSRNGSSERRQRLRLMERGAELLGTDRGRLRSELPNSLASALDASRFDGRLRARLLKRSGLIEAPEMLDREGLMFLSTGKDGSDISGLSMRLGAACHAPNLRRVVDRDALMALTGDLGIGLAELSSLVFSAPKSMRLQLKLAPTASEQGGLASAIRTDGARCWLCWVDTKSEQVSRFLRLATPLSLIDAAGDMSGLGSAERTARAALAGRKIAQLNAESTGQATPIAAE